MQSLQAAHAAIVYMNACKRDRASETGADWVRPPFCAKTDANTCYASWLGRGLLVALVWPVCTDDEAACSCTLAKGLATSQTCLDWHRIALAVVKPLSHGFGNSSCSVLKGTAAACSGCFCEYCYSTCRPAASRLVYACQASTVILRNSSPWHTPLPDKRCVFSQSTTVTNRDCQLYDKAQQ